jgi:WD40 repeat protein
VYSLTQVHGISFAPHEQVLASGSADNSARLWDVETGTSKGVLNAHEGQVFNVAWHPSGRMLATCSEDKKVRRFSQLFWSKIHEYIFVVVVNQLRNSPHQ